jgi:hypothetical protein
MRLDDYTPHFHLAGDLDTPGSTVPYDALSASFSKLPKMTLHYAGKPWIWIARESYFLKITINSGLHDNGQNYWKIRTNHEWHKHDDVMPMIWCAISDCLERKAKFRNEERKYPYPASVLLLKYLGPQFKRAKKVITPKQRALVHQIDWSLKPGYVN